jgi:hypothetical protein
VNATKYWWIVQGKRADGFSTFSASRSFTTIFAIPAAPMLASPDQNATNQPTTLTLSWNTVPGAQSFRIQTSFDSLFSSTLIDIDTLHSTSFALNGLGLNTRYFWRVSAANTAGVSSFSEVRSFVTVLTTSVEVIAEGVPLVFALSQNYPNPFNPSTKIEFSMPESGRVTLRVFDTIGRVVAELYNGEAEPGRRYRATFDGAGLSSGMYLARLEWNGKQIVKKMMFVK